MSNAVLLVTSFVVNALWQLPLIAAVGWVLSRWLKRAGPELQHQVWVAALILATVAPATPILRGFFAHDASHGQGIVMPVLMLSPHAGGNISLTDAHIILPLTAIYLVCGLYVVALAFF